LLRSCSAWHAFQAHCSKLDPQKIIEYLLLDETFPRSIACCITEVHHALRELSGTGALNDMSAPVRHSGRLRADLAYSTVDELTTMGLHEFVDELQTRLGQIGESIFETFVLYADAKPDEDIHHVSHLGAFHAHAAEEDAQVQQQQQQQQ
ncbi:MAG TPA: alpha-E domain-containing protein, partial [Prosthecobacter sp.]